MATMKTVKVLGFTYAKVHQNPYDPNGPAIVENTMATRGEEVDFDELVPYDQNRADKYEVFYTDEEMERLQPDGTLAPAADEPGAANGDSIVLDETSSVEDLSAWIREDEPTVDEVVELAGNSPLMARKLIDAESAATGGDPRKTVTTKLEKIANQAPAS